MKNNNIQFFFIDLVSAALHLHHLTIARKFIRIIIKLVKYRYKASIKWFDLLISLIQM